MTAAEAKKISARHHSGWNAEARAHPLDGKSVAEWVAEARKGWPRVPVPGDPLKAALKVAQAHAGSDKLSLAGFEEV